MKTEKNGVITPRRLLTFNVASAGLPAGEAVGRLARYMSRAVRPLPACRQVKQFGG
jgi:hypothetical protein